MLNSDPDLARISIEELASFGSPYSMLFVAEALRKGTIYEKDIEKARGWYGFVSEAGLPHGNYGLALIHIETENWVEAIVQLKICVDLEFEPAYNALATLYLRGVGVDMDLSKAIDLWKRGDKKNHVWSTRNLGIQYINGRSGCYRIPIGVLLVIKGIILITALVFLDEYSSKLIK